MHSSCILDSVANLLVRRMVFVGNVQKSPIAFHLKGMDPSLCFCCQGPPLTGIKETLEASEMYLSLHMIFSLERAAVVWAILERISGFDPSFENIAPRYLKFSTSSSLWPRGVCHHFCLVWTDLHFVPCGVVLSRQSVGTPASSSLLQLRQCHLQSSGSIKTSAKRKLVMSPLMLRLPSWSSNASNMILSRKMLKRVGKSNTLVERLL